MNNSKIKGDVTELEAILAFRRLGYQVSIPYGNGSRYDFIVDIDGMLLRIQSKTSRQIKDKPNMFFFSARSKSANTNQHKEHIYTPNEVDYFVTMWQGVCYMISIHEVTKSTVNFIIDNNSSVYSQSRLAQDYELSKVVGFILKHKDKLNTTNNYYLQDITKNNVQCVRVSYPIVATNPNTGEEVERFNNDNELKQFLGIKQLCHVYEVCRGIKNTAYGYKWQYANVA